MVREHGPSIAGRSALVNRPPEKGEKEKRERGKRRKVQKKFSVLRGPRHLQEDV